MFCLKSKPRKEAEKRKLDRLLQTRQIDFEFDRSARLRAKIMARGLMYDELSGKKFAFREEVIFKRD